MQGAEAYVPPRAQLVMYGSHNYKLRLVISTVIYSDSEAHTHKRPRILLKALYIICIIVSNALKRMFLKSRI